MHTMYSAHFLPAGFQVAITFLLATAPLISATTHPSYSGLDPPVQRRSDDMGLPDGWCNLGCYTDDPEMRTLTSLTNSDKVNMTVLNCVDFCITYGDHTYAGVEDGKGCYCGNTLTNGSTNAPAGDCTSPCTGNHMQNCGGPKNLNLYWNGRAPQPPPSMIENPSNWYLMGCYMDTGRTNDALTLTMPAVDYDDPNGEKNDAEKCIQSCSELGYSFAGMEGATQCFCDNKINQGRKPVDQMYCMLACPGNSLQLCGGPHSIVIYSATKTPG